MATINGQFTITFTANESANSADYVISGATSATGSVVISCTAPIPGPCSFTVPVTYDTPSCDELTIDVTLYSDCDPDNTITYSQTFPLNEGCVTYRLLCDKAPEGCQGFNTTELCPTCTVRNVSTVIDSLATINPSATPPLNVPRDFIPYGTELFFCYSDVTQIRQQLNLNDWVFEPYPDGCCWECRRYSFLFNPAELTYSTPNTPPFPAGVRTLPDVFPSIIGTECNDEYHCYIPFKYVLNPAGYYGNDISQPIVVQACLRKDSYTIIGAKYGVGVTDLGPCSI